MQTLSNWRFATRPGDEPHRRTASGRQAAAVVLCQATPRAAAVKSGVLQVFEDFGAQVLMPSMA
jgi:hypothetical protein